MAAVPELEEVTARFYAAVNQLQRGDPQPMFALWSHRDDAMNLGPQGGRQRGWAEIQAYFARAARQAGANPAAASAAVSDTVVAIVGDLAYVSGMEEVRVSGETQERRFTARH